MLNKPRQSSKSPGTESIQSGSLSTGSKNDNKKPVISRSPSSDESSKAAVPVAVQSKPIISRLSDSNQSSRESSPKIAPPKRPDNNSSDSSPESSPAPTPKPPISVFKPTKPPITTSVKMPVVQPKSSDEKKKTTPPPTKPPAQPSPKPTTEVTSLNSKPKQSTKDIEYEISKLIPITNNRDIQKYVSIFEKVDPHDGHTTYLGSGTFSQLEDCITSCLARERHCRGAKYDYEKYDYPSKSLTRASILEDYSYDGIISSNHSICDSYYNNHYNRRKKSAAELSLSEIRQVNDALAKYGIPIFSNQPNPHYPHAPQHNIGEIISACRLLIEDPALANLANRHSAVSHVWDAARFGHPSPPQTGGYASPAVQSVASHLFNHSNQPPYSPVQSVLSHLFPGQSSSPPPQHFIASSYNSPPNQYPGSHPYPY